KVKDLPFVNSTITVEDPQITKLLVRALNEGKPLDKPLGGDAKNPIPITFAAGQTTVTVTPKIKIGPGNNTITVFDADKPREDGAQASADISCVGDKCGVV